MSEQKIPNIAPLPAPTGVSLAQSNRDVDAEGAADIALLTTFSGGVQGAAGYECEWSDNAGQTSNMRSDTGKAWFIADTSRSYRARWRALDWSGLPGHWSLPSEHVTPVAPTVDA